MSKKYIILLIILVGNLVLGACQKEYNPNHPSGGGFFGFDIGDAHYEESRTRYLGGNESSAKCGESKDTIAILAFCGSSQPSSFNTNFVWIQIPISDIRSGEIIKLRAQNQRVCYWVYAGTKMAKILNASVIVHKRYKGIFAGTFEMEIMADGVPYHLTNGYFDVKRQGWEEYQYCKNTLNDYLEWSSYE